MIRRAAVLSVAGVAALGMGGCGKVLKADGAEKTLTEFVKSRTGSTISDATCPSGVDAKVGKTLNCTFTGPDGDYTAAMNVTSVKGSRVAFQITTSKKP